MRSRRRSIEERTEEILQRNRSTNLSLSSNPVRSEFEDAYRDIMAGLSSEAPSASELPPASKSPEQLKSPDSFDLSAADFEPGLFAARRKMEKAAERGRRMSFDQEMFLGRERIRNSSSPDLKASRRSTLDSNRFSTALSSIQFSEEGDRKDAMRRGFSSPDPSDNELYNNLLQITPVAQNEDQSMPTDEKEYEDDFEVDPSAVETAIVPTENKAVSSEMATVEQIMQRWYSLGKDSQLNLQQEDKKSPDEKMNSRNKSDEEETASEPINYGKQLIDAFPIGGDLVTSIPLSRASGPRLEGQLSGFGHPEVKLVNEPVIEEKNNEAMELTEHTPLKSSSPISQGYESEDKRSPIEPVKPSDPRPEDIELDGSESANEVQDIREDVRVEGDPMPSLSTPVVTYNPVPQTREKALPVESEKLRIPVRPKFDEPERASSIVTLLSETVNNLKSKLGQKTITTSRISVNFDVVIRNLLEVVAEVEAKIYSIQSMEQSIALQETVLQSREKAFTVSREQALDDLNNRILSLTKDKSDLQQQLQLKDQEVRDLNRELNLLKATCLEKTLGSGKRQSTDRPVTSEVSPSLEVNLKEMTHEELKNEFLVQERLISSYQKENERLTKLLKDEELRAITNQALFFDKQEETNRELNRLRNENVTSETLYARKKKSAEELRIELEQDGRIRFLQDKVSELEEQMVQREKGFRNTIQKYKQQCQELQSMLNQRQQPFAQELEAELRLYKDEVASLKKELERRERCFTSLETVERQLLISRREVTVARRQLSTLGATSEEIEFFFAGSLPLSQLLVRLDERGSDGFTSSCLETYKKKIRSLEKTIESLTKSLRDKRPDSVSGLIRAIREPAKRKEDTIEAERRLEELQEELRFRRDSYEISLSELRLQHESVVSGMKEKIEELTRQIKRFEDDSNPPSDRAVANREDDAEKIRKFYTKKLEQMHSRYEKQIQAMKRAPQHSEITTPPAPGMPSHDKPELLVAEKGISCRPSVYDNECQTEIVDASLQLSPVQSACVECQTEEYLSHGPLSPGSDTRTSTLEKRILAMEANLNERERTFYSAIQQVELSSQIEKQLLQSEFQKEILAKDQRIQEFEAQLQLLLSQLSVIKQRL